MKKLISALMALCLVLSISVTAFAAEIDQETDPKTSQATITTSIAPTYTVTIPESVSVAFNAETTDFGAIEVTAAQLDPGKCIQVSLNASGELENKADSSKVLPYTVSCGDSEFTSAKYLAAGEKSDLKINITREDWNKAYAGDYEDIVIFEVAYINQ